MRSLTSEQLIFGEIYTRADLKKLFNIQDASINNGIFQPKGTDSVWLFVTEKKTSDRVQYLDALINDTLQMDGQLKGRTDHLITEHHIRGLELLVFHRREKYEHQGAGFRYEGAFEYERHSGSAPTSFVLKRHFAVDHESSTSKIDLNMRAEEGFSPSSLEDARERIMASIVRRRGQSRFRKQLLNAYSNRCAVTGCSVEAILEAAHIHPYYGEKTDIVPNGLLLRADIHTLFDLGLLWIDPDTLHIIVSSRLQDSEYAELNHKPLILPKKTVNHPSRAAITHRRELQKNVDHI